MKDIANTLGLQSREQYENVYDRRLYDHITFFEDSYGYQMWDEEYVRNDSTVWKLCRRARTHDTDIHETLAGWWYKVFLSLPIWKFQQEIEKNEFIVHNILDGKFFIWFTDGFKNVAIIYDVSYIPEKVYDIIIGAINYKA